MNLEAISARRSEPSAGPSPTWSGQRKLTVGAPGDVYEQEADRVADAVVSARDVHTPSLHASGAAIQRMCATCDDEQVQRKPIDGAASVAGAAADGLSASSGHSLPAALGGFMQQRFGRDFSAVRLHTGAQAEASAASLSARAFTIGRDIAFGAGQYAPDTREGRRLIAHELTHVVQQSGGAATPAIQRDELATNDDKTKAKPPAWTPPSHCGTDFCRPFASRADAISARDDLGLTSWSMLRIGISAKVASKVMPLWDEWAAGGGPVRDISPTFGTDFMLSPTTADTATFLRSAMTTAVVARPRLAPGAATTLSIASLIPTEVAAIDDPASPSQMNFNIPADIPGNIAGGIGKDEAANPIGAMPSPQDDARIANGTVTIVGATGGDQLVIPALTFTVKDTLDLCPGDCGTGMEQIATVPMSRWEASSISGDVPFTVDFSPPPALMGPFIVPAGGVPKPKPPTPGGDER